MIRSTPTARVPCRLKSLYAVSSTRSRPLLASCAGPFSRGHGARDGTDLSRRLPGHPASTAADRHAPTSSITAGTSSSATTSWIFGAARAARSRTRCARWARASAASACSAGASGAPWRSAAPDGGDQRGDALQRAAAREPLERLRARDAERRARGGGAQLGGQRTAAPAPDLAQRPQRGQAGADRDVQEVEDVGQLGRHRGAPAPRRARQPGVGRDEGAGRRGGDRRPARGGRGAARRAGSAADERGHRRPALERHDLGDRHRRRRPAASSRRARSRGAAGAPMRRPRRASAARHARAGAAAPRAAASARRPRRARRSRAAAQRGGEDGEEQRRRRSPDALPHAARCGG